MTHVAGTMIRVRWDDGNESSLVPASGSLHVVRRARERLGKRQWLLHGASLPRRDQLPGSICCEPWPEPVSLCEIAEHATYGGVDTSQRRGAPEGAGRPQRVQFSAHTVNLGKHSRRSQPRSVEFVTEYRDTFVGDRSLILRVAGGCACVCHILVLLVVFLSRLGERVLQAVCPLLCLVDLVRPRVRDEVIEHVGGDRERLQKRGLIGVSIESVEPVEHSEPVTRLEQHRLPSLVRRFVGLRHGCFHDHDPGRKLDQSAPASTSRSKPSTSTFRKSTGPGTWSATTCASVQTGTSIGVNSWPSAR